MFYLGSKILWIITDPVAILLLLVLVATALARTRLRRTSFTAGILASLLLLLTAFTNLGEMLVQPLESRFQRPAEPAQVHGIVLLGGAAHPEIIAARGGYEFTEAADRFVEVLRLARLYPAAKVVVSGGIGELGGGGVGDAALAASFFPTMGIAAERLVLEENSRTTAENAEFVAAIVPRVPTETWLLVTSAFHMPRSVGAFRREGFHVIAWPVDYRSRPGRGFGLDLQGPAQNLALFSTAIKEWIGLLAYGLAGRTSSLFPGPEA